MLVQGGGEELRKDENFIAARVKSIGNRDVDEFITPSKTNRRLAMALRQGE